MKGGLYGCLSGFIISRVQSRDGRWRVMTSRMHMSLGEGMGFERAIGSLRRGDEPTCSNNGNELSDPIISCRRRFSVFVHTTNLP